MRLEWDLVQDFVECSKAKMYKREQKCRFVYLCIPSGWCWIDIVSHEKNHNWITKTVANFIDLDWSCFVIQRSGAIETFLNLLDEVWREINLRSEKQNQEQSKHKLGLIAERFKCRKHRELHKEVQECLVCCMLRWTSTILYESIKRL